MPAAHTHTHTAKWGSFGRQVWARGRDWEACEQQGVCEEKFGEKCVCLFV